MADGRTHDLHGVVAAVLASLAAAILWMRHITSAEAFALPAGVLVGAWLLSPDLDMWGTSPIKRWGPLRLIWYPYTKMFQHRGYSHTWIVGPCTRLLYLGVPVVGLWWYHCELDGYGPWLVYLTAGIIAGNWVHLMGDGIAPWSWSGKPR